VIGALVDLFELRNQLIGKVERGELTPEAAELEAARLGPQALQYRPDPEKFNPLKEPHWTLPMAVAWIASRSLADVREWWDKYRALCWDWRFRRSRFGFDGPIEKR
jgi:hypothetical protein